MCFMPSNPWKGPSGCIEMSRTRGARSVRYRAVPQKVPLVPRPATKCVSRPSVCIQISGPVVSKWARQLAVLPYWST